jgi:hypothetical protein
LVKDKNIIKLSGNPVKIFENEAIKLANFKIIKKGLGEYYKILYNRPVAKFKRFNGSYNTITPIYYSFNKSTVRSIDYYNTESNTITYDSGLYYSKARMELSASAQYKINSLNSYLKAKFLSTSGYIINSKNDFNYIDATLSYLRPITFLYMQKFYLGGGFRLLHFSNSNSAITQSDFLLNPSISLSAKDLFLNEINSPLDIYIEYSYLFKNLNSSLWGGSRLLSEIRYGIYGNELGELSLSLMVGLLKIHNNFNRIVDNKFLGGIVYQW